MGLMACFSPVRSQVVVEEVGVFQDQLARAKQAYLDKDWAKAVQALEPLIATLTQWEKTGRIQPSDEEIFLQALELRGLCRGNLKDLPGAREDFSRYVTLRPEKNLSQTPAPKIQKLFDEVRQGLTGTVILTVDPGDAALSVDGRDLGTSYPRALALIKGLHKLRWSRSGYEPVTRDIDVETGAQSTLEIRLAANAKTVYFLVQPEGTRLFLGKKLIATADKPATSSEELARFCKDSGVDPSSTFVIAAVNLPPGEHKVTLTRECYETRDFMVKVSVDQERSVPGYTKPVILQRRAVDFKVTSAPSGATVAIDGKSVGVTPVVLAKFCVGEHEFLLSKAGAGEYRAKLTITETGPFTLEATLRPTLLWAGLTRDQETSAELAKAYDESIRAAAVKLLRFNATFSTESDPLLPDTYFDEGIGDEDRVTSVESLCEAYRCQGVLVGKVSRRKGAAHLDLRLFLPGVTGFDTFSADIKSPMEADACLGSLDADPAGALSGGAFQVSDLPGFPTPVVIHGSGDPMGPALGDRVERIGETPVHDAETVRRLLGGEPGLEITFRRGEETFTWKPSRYLAPVIPYSGPSAAYRRSVLLFRQAVQAGETDGATLVAKMNLACAWLNLGRAGNALAALDGATSAGNNPERLSSVAYLRAVALARLGKLDEAREQAATAAADSSASLDGLGEIPVQPLAKDLLNQLPAPTVTRLPFPGEPKG